MFTKKKHHKPESKKNVSILCNTVRKEKKHRAIDQRFVEYLHESSKYRVNIVDEVVNKN